ncbi:MAG: type II toxin-antitoxin system MqsR family toxin [Deltaproteobacteria bacterium]|nr:type II toxin-antitoxin system MqsR family toxin [Deltaproteobacteria bacterium]
MATKARYLLKDVFRLIADGSYWFSARPRSSYAVIKAYGSSGKTLSADEAEAFILKAIGDLTEGHFCESVLQWNDPKCIADVYGLIYDERPWYVKFRIDSEEGETLEEISFHPPEKEMKTVNGSVIPKGANDGKE